MFSSGILFLLLIIVLSIVGKMVFSLCLVSLLICFLVFNLLFEIFLVSLCFDFFLWSSSSKIRRFTSQLA